MNNVAVVRFRGSGEVSLWSSSDAATLCACCEVYSINLYVCNTLCLATMLCHRGIDSMTTCITSPTNNVCARVVLGSDEGVYCRRT